MTNREYVMQRLHDMITAEERQEEAMDRKLVADNARLNHRMRAN